MYLLKISAFYKVRFRIEGQILLLFMLLTFVRMTTTVQ